MTQSISPNFVAQLKKCISLAQDVATHVEAKQAFEQLRGNLEAENPLTAELLELLWQDAIALSTFRSFLAADVRCGKRFERSHD